MLPELINFIPRQTQTLKQLGLIHQNIILRPYNLIIMFHNLVPEIVHVFVHSIDFPLSRVIDPRSLVPDRISNNSFQLVNIRFRFSLQFFNSVLQVGYRCQKSVHVFVIQCVQKYWPGFEIWSFLRFLE